MKNQRIKRRFLSLSFLSLMIPATRLCAQTGPVTALSFDGTGGAYLSIGGAPVSPPWTAEFWVNRQDSPTYSAALLADSDTALKLEQYNFTRQVGFTQFGVADYNFGYTVPAGAWTHLAFVCNGGTTFLYTNGALAGSVAATIALPLAQFGNDKAQDHLKGTIDEVRVWNVTRSQSQIHINMNRSLSPQTNLVAYWHFDEGTGSFAYDSSGNGYTGTLTNNPAWVASGVPFVPGVVTLPASQTATNSAILNGLVYPNGIPATAWFEWGPTTNFGNLTAFTSAGSGTNSVPVALPVTGLSAGEPFYYSIGASNIFGLAFGDIESSPGDNGIPKLSIALNGNDAIVSWPASVTSYSLENTTNLSGIPIWTEVSEVPQVVGNQNNVTMPVGSTNRFLRLHQASSPVGLTFNGVPAFNLGLDSTANASCGCSGESPYSQGPSEAGGGSVLLHNGEFVQHAMDLEVPSRGFGWKMARSYRSGINFDGPLGHNWDFSYNRRLSVQTNGDVLRMDGYGRADRYVYTTNGYTAPRGFYTQLIQYPDGSFRERDRYGTKIYYSTTNGQGIARMTESQDRNGNRMQFAYNSQGQLSRVLDTLGRAYLYHYDAVTGRLIEVDDFTGRFVKYSYDFHGDLLAVTSPAVTGTPNGNDFPNGKTWQYTYSSEFADDRLNHNLLTITAPNEVAADGLPRVIAQYQNNTNSPNLDRLTQLTVEGVNGSGIPAGGTISYQYQNLGSAGSNDFNMAVFQNTVTDRNGNQSQYQFNQLGNIVQLREFSRGLRAGEPAYFQTQHTYNSDGEVLSTVKPLSNSVSFTYDSGNPDRFQQGNLLSEIRIPDSNRGGDQALIQSTMRYEPVYNQLLATTSSQGNDASYVPQNGGTNSQARYTTIFTYDYQEGLDYTNLAAELGITASDAQARLSTVPMGLGDVNGDSQTGQIHGNRIRTARPTVTLLPSSNEAVVEGSTQQPIVSLSIYNQLGQTISERDPEGNVTQYSYNPENNPSGSSQNPTPSVGAGPFGYVHQVTADSVSSAGRDSGANPTAASVATIFGYDAVGNITRSIDGRGIATDYIVNQLNQIVQTTRAAAHGLITNSVSEPIALTDFQYLARTYYDADNNVIRQEVEDRGNTSGTGGFVTTLYEYDILNHEIQMAQEVDANTWLTNQFRYDANGNQTLVIQPVGNATSSVFDERNLLFQRTVGTATPSAGTLGAPVIMSARPGVPSVYTLNYDANGNLIESVDAADKDGSAANNSSIAGAGDVTRTAYDGFDRAKVITDAVGNQTFIIYDPASQAVKSTHRGPLGGASPVNTLGAGNVDLSIVESSYDELGRLFQSDRHLFIPAGVATQRIPNISEGPLTPGDGKVTTRFDYDRNSRQTFIVDDNMNISRQFYDGANRLIKTLDAENNSTESAYDANGNTIEIRSTDVCQEAGITNEIFLTTFFYDSLNRLLRSVDNIGQTVEYRYDSRNNVVAASDASGPPSGSIARRAFNGGALTVNTINGFGNVTLSSFDGLNRKIRQDSVMTASGKGDGTNIGADIFGIKTTTPAPDLSQAGGDGLITVRYLYDNNSLLTSLTDDNGNQTQYTYDNHNRRLTETKGICVAPNLANRCETPTTISLKYDTDGDTTQIVDENGSIVTNRFDAIHRLITRVVARATNVIGTTEATFQYDGLSRPVLGTDNNDPLDTSDDSAVTYAYDSFGRVIEETQQIGSSPAMAVSSSWEAANHRSSLIYPNGRAVTNTFDHLNRIQSIGDVGTTIPVASYSFIGKARVAERQTPLNNTKLTYLDNAGLNDVGYDGLRRTVQLTHFQGTNILTGFAHTYDRRNNPLSETKLHATNDSELYQFDSEDRLFEFSKGTLNSNGTFITTPSLHAALQTNWTFDGVGNWERVNNETRQHNSFNEIIQRSNTLGVATIVSDKNGSETDNGTLTFQCDYKNRLRKVSRKSDGMLLATYAYDTSNRRISKTVTNSGALNGVTRYYSSGGQELEERDGTNGLMQQYVYGRYIDEPLVLDRNLNGDSTANGTGDQRLFYQANRQHSISALTDTTGNVVEGYEYDAYGTRTVFSPGANGKVDFGGDDNVTSAGVSLLGNAIGFTGRRLDAETGLYYYRNRYLSPIEGRFISRDPAGYGGGDLNLQAYVGGRALSSLDPSGLGPIEDVVNWCLTHPDECNAVDKVKEIWDETDKFREYLDEREAQWERDVGNEVVNTLNEAVHVWNQSAIDHRPTYQQHVEAVSFANEPLVFYPREILNASADSRSRDLVELAATQKREQAQAAAQQAQALEDKAVQIMDNAIGIVEGAVKQCNDIDALKRGTAQDFANILEAMADKMLTVVNSATEAYNAAKNGDVSSANAFIKQGNTSLNDMQNLSTDISVDIYHLEEEGLINGVNFRSNGNTSNPNNSNSSTGTPVPSNPGVGDPGGWLTGPSGNCDTCE